MSFAVDWALKTNYLPHCSPNMTFVVDWVLKADYLSIDPIYKGVLQTQKLRASLVEAQGYQRFPIFF